MAPFIGSLEPCVRKGTHVATSVQPHVSCCNHGTPWSWSSLICQASCLGHLLSFDGSRAPTCNEVRDTIVYSMLSWLTSTNYSMPAPPPIIVVLVNTFFRIRKFLLQYLALPRSHGSRKMYIATYPSSSSPDHYHALRYRAFPWYVESTTSKKMKAWLKGSPLPGPMFHDQGYKILDLGPDELRGEGYAAMREMEGSIRVARGVE